MSKLILYNRFSGFDFKKNGFTRQTFTDKFYEKEEICRYKFDEYYIFINDKSSIDSDVRVEVCFFYEFDGKMYKLREVTTQMVLGSTEMIGLNCKNGDELMEIVNFLKKVVK